MKFNGHLKGCNIYSSNYFTGMMKEVCGVLKTQLITVVDFLLQKKMQYEPGKIVSLAVCYLKILFPRVKSFDIGDECKYAP